MTKLLEENHIALPEFAKRWECKQGNGKAEHALGAWVKPNSISLFLIALFLIHILIYQNLKPPSLP